ncbi:hypothetical protein J2Y55_000620 [Bosea sp. BE125]|nr:hypothetical protein [Bosea sp. BE125]
MSHIPQSPEGEPERAEADAAALIEKGKRWFAEAREQTKRDDEDIAAWHQRLADRMDGIRGPYFTDSKSD